MRRLAYNFAVTTAMAALVASVFFGCSQTVVPSEEDIQLAEEQQRILEHSSSSKKKKSAAPSSSSKAQSSSAERQSSAAPSSSSKAQSSSAAKPSLADIYDAVTAEGAYTTRDSVAAYLCKFDKLPSNYVDKNEGKKLYEAAGNTFSKWNFNPWETLGVMIGGDNFNNFASDPDNYHENLPEGNYREADIEYNAPKRGSKRLVYQPDCVIYYTADHYDTYTRLEF